MWIASAASFRLVADVGFERGIISSLLDSVVFALFTSVLLALSKLLGFKIPLNLMIAGAGVVWILGPYFYDMYLPRSPYFGFFAFGDTVITNGVITSHGKQIFLAQALAKATTIICAFSIYFTVNRIGENND